VTPERGRLVVSIHDVAAASAEASAAWSADLAARDVPATLLVIGGPWRGVDLSRAPDLAGWLRYREATGDEIALHGWHHLAPPSGPLWRRAHARVVARGAAEFAALDHADASWRLSWSRELLVDQGLHPVGFTPPGWLASPASRRVCGDLGLRYLTSRLSVFDLMTGARHRIPAYCHRPGSRLEVLGSRLLVRATAARAAAGRTVRVALHPADLERPGLRSATLEAIDGALAAGLRPSTYRDLLPSVQALR